MHPLLSNRTTLAVYLTVWLGLALALSALLRVPAILSWRDALLLSGMLCLILSFLCLGPWYTCRTLPLTSTKRWQLAYNHGAAAILVTSFWVACARGVATLLGVRLGPELPILIALSLLLYYLSVAVHYAYFAIETSRQAALEARDAELRALKAQINPHFLFNSLNSIAALAFSDGARARDMCIRLSDFLRNTLGLGERASIAWKDELDLVRAYLDVEKVRFGSRLAVEMNIHDECAECQVPPLVLQPLIENAVKHGIATLVEGGTIRVESGLVPGDGRARLLRVTVENDFDPDSPTPRRHGLGLRNVRSRLETRFGKTATLLARAEDNRFKAEMIFPCHMVD
jgi:two-component system, LytTR family, sensor histidine kinase AlgZ